LFILRKYEIYLLDFHDKLTGDMEDTLGHGLSKTDDDLLPSLIANNKKKDKEKLSLF
jgi:hypothetical protein